MKKSRQNGAGRVSEAADKAAQNKAIVAVAVIILLLVLFSACQSGLLGTLSCLPIGKPVSDSDITVSDTELVTSDGDASEVVSGGDAPVSSSDLPEEPSASDTVVVYYPEVHIDGITLPEQYGAGLFDAGAAMWLINEYRSQNGLYQLLPGDFGLQQVARIRLREAAELFSHDRPDGRTFSSVYDETGLFYRHCAENLALGQYTAEEVVRDWIESDTHRANLLSQTVTHMQVMTANREDGRAVWVFEAYSAP